MRKSGFTLLELVIVIAIIAILAGAMVPMFSASRLEARQAKVNVDEDAIKTASTMLHHDTGEWPAEGDQGEGLITDDDGTGVAIPDWSGPYLDGWRDDPWGNSYEIYDSGSDPTARRVRSLGADGAIDGTGANADIELVITPDIDL